LDYPLVWGNLNRFCRLREVLVFATAVTRFRQAAIAKRLAKILNERGYLLDINLITAGGLLQDIAKGKQKHAKEGSKS